MQVGFVVDGRDHGIHVGQLAPQTEIGADERRSCSTTSPSPTVTSSTARPAARAVTAAAMLRSVRSKVDPRAQEAAARARTGTIVGLEQRRLEAAGRIDRLGILALGVGV